MTAAIIAAICSAVAAGFSALAAWKSLSLAKTTAAQAADAERRNLLRDIEETARAIQVESRRAASVYERVKPLQDAAFSLTGSYGGSAHNEIIAGTDKTSERIAEPHEQAGKLAIVPAGGQLSASDLAARLPALRTHLIEVRGILDDRLTEIDGWTNNIASRVAKRNEDAREWMRRPPIPGIYPSEPK